MRLICLAGIMRLIYYGFFLLYYRKLFPAKNTRPIPVILTLIAIFGVNFLPVIRSMPMSSLPIMLTVMIMGLRISTNMNWLQALHGGSICVIYSCSFCGIVAELCTIFSQYRIVIVSTQIRLLAFPASLLFFLLLRKLFFNDKKHKQFLENIAHYKLVIILEAVAAINLTIIYLGRFGLSDIWNLEMALLASAFTVGVLVYSILYAAKNIESIEEKWDKKLLEKQFENQLRHYTLCQKHTKSFQAFRHDYKALMASLKILIMQGQNEEALRLIDNIHEEINKKSTPLKKFSRPIVLDAILHDAANICEENKVPYTFHLFLPRNTGLSILSQIRILTNIFNNAIEACLKVPEQDRFLEMISRTDESWVTMEVRNPYAGDLVLDNGRLVSTKPKSEFHGLGLQSVHEIIEKLGGFVFYDIDKEKHIFLIRIHLPKIYEHYENIML